MNLARAHNLPAPGLLWGAYPERPAAGRGWLNKLAESIQRRLVLPETWQRRNYRDLARRVSTSADAWADEEPAAFTRRLYAAQAALRQEGLHGRALEDALALAALQCRRQLGVQPFESQIMAARAMLECRLVEMATGEGKTIAVALAAATAALTGMPVHVITANDYLVERDAERLGPFYTALGLSVGQVVSRHDSNARRTAYARDVVYCTAKEIGFDYLRDHAAGKRRGDELRRRAEHLAGTAKHAPLLRGLCMAIVDEADSILIDEARVPLILSRRVDSPHEQADYAQALTLAGDLREGVDFKLDREQRQVRLSEQGAAVLEAALPELASCWRHRLYREEWVRQALSALHLFERDRDYILRDGRVDIVDSTTGRVAAGRSWSRGLHQLIELKEGCEPTPAHATAAQITFQRLFRRYLRLSGVSGTLSESAGELARIYGLRVYRQPLRQPSQRRIDPVRVFPDRNALWRAVAERAAELRQAGRPVLIGADSVADSDALAQVLADAGLPFRVLNARQDREEAETVALAGLRGQITVTTNMAGRGTDIPLGPGVEKLGGLHVLSCQHNGSRRIDRQLIGRCARQGSAGSAERWLCLDADLLHRHWPQAWLDRLTPHLERAPGRLLMRALEALAQRHEEARDAGARRRLMQSDEQTERQLAFGGAME